MRTRGVLDSSLTMLREGYGWLPNRRARTDNGVVHTRVLGQRAVGLCGPEAERFFYDEAHVHRHTALPGPVQATLFGYGAVHTLDGLAHRHRKDIFVRLLLTRPTTGLVERVAEAWDAAPWTPGRPVVLFDEASRVLTRGVCRWAGVPVAADDIPALARDLVAMVDGFATLGPRHWRARRARRRREGQLAELVRGVRDGTVAAPAGSALDVVAAHRDLDDDPLSPELAAVELLNVLRPTVAVCWFVAFAAHALHRWPRYRQPLAAADPEFVEAFGHEVRRFYPFAPFIGGRAVTDLTFRGESIPAGSLVLLDLWGHDHDAEYWDDPFVFRPERFVGGEIGPFDLVPQGAGDPMTNHRCPGEPATVAVLNALLPRLAAMDYELPVQDLSISLRRVPAMPRSGVVIVPRTVPSGR